MEQNIAYNIDPFTLFCPNNFLAQNSEECYITEVQNLGQLLTIT